MGWIGMWSHLATNYLVILAIVTLVVFSILLFFKPLLWARLFLWSLPEETDLTVYFGRCLGAFALVTDAMFLHAALTGTGVVTMLQFFTLFCALMVIVHVWGAIARIQPITETLEIGLWAGLTMLTLMFMPMSV